MRQVIDGNGQDSTVVVRAWLAANNELWLRNLYVIGDPDDPRSLWLTDHESPLLWSAWGTFLPAVIKRGNVTSEVGLAVSPLDVTWSPPAARRTPRIQDASPYELARIGFYDNWPVRVWTVYMPTSGDANTFGASELFGGRIADSMVARGEIKFKVNSFLDVVNQNVPTNVIELTNTLAAYRAATPPTGLSVVPQFDVLTGSTERVITGDCTAPSAHQVFADDAFKFGYLVFNHGGTLDGLWSAVIHNVGGASPNNYFTLFSAMPWAPTPGVDTFYVSATFPVNQADGEYVGFPYVPVPEASL